MPVVKRRGNSRMSQKEVPRVASMEEMPRRAISDEVSKPSPKRTPRGSVKSSQRFGRIGIGEQGDRHIFHGRSIRRNRPRRMGKRMPVECEGESTIAFGLLGSGFELGDPGSVGGRKETGWEIGVCMIWRIRRRMRKRM